jgi:hypothetical protein
MRPRDYASSCNSMSEEHMHMDAREYWYYAIGLALVVAVVALA